MSKYVAYGALVVALLSLVIVLTSGSTVTERIVEKMDLGGVTNLDSLTLGEDLVVGDDVTITGDVTFKEKVASIAATNQYSTSTLTAAQSGTTFYLSASGTTITLPAVTTAGLNYMFVVGGALDTGNVIIDSAEGDNIDGTLIVAGAVVDCRGEDQINFVVDGEQTGDYVEVRSNGTQWVIGDSGTLTAGKMTCTDPS